MKYLKLFEEFHSAKAKEVNEATTKKFETDFNNMIKDIKSGYGWIDPEYVANTWENSSDSIDFELVKGEIYKRLIAAGLLAYPDDNDEEKAGKKVKSLKELGIKESQIEESHFKVGDKVKMSHGGTGVIVSLDKEDGADDEAYYNIELPNGDVMKHAPNELEKVNEAAMPLNKLVQKFNDEYPKFDPKAKFDYFSARILSGFVYDNWDKITGLRKSTRNDEMMFPSSVDAFVDAVTYEGFYDENYEKFEEVFADMQR